ncbi:MAG TPA: molecular chaperone TorD family protein [Burkholderiaceae bacterium]|nr:molecular chaperone TorD family protein [Burkholderiaceae bacterium]
MSDTPLQFSPGGDAEEIARADLYGVLAQLWAAPPGEESMPQLQDAPVAPGAAEATLAEPWRNLVQVIKATSASAAADEYDALFQGVGKPEVFLYGSYYLTGFLNERPLVRLRHDLAALGLARDETRGETEDHVSFVLEVMRYLIAGDDVAVCNLERQRLFFRAHVQTWVESFCDAVAAHPRANVYRAVAALTRSFVQVETQGFDMLEA